MSGQIALPVDLLRYVSYAAGAHRGGQSPPPLYPGLRPAKSPLRGPFDLSLQASGRAEAASVQNTALSPHPCGLPRPSGNVSAILRPPAPAVSVAQVGISTTGRTTPGRVRQQPPPGKNTGAVPDILPGGVALAGPGWGETTGGLCRPDKAFMPPSGTTTGTVPDRPGIPGSLQRLRQIVALHACVREVGQRHLQLIA